MSGSRGKDTSQLPLNLDVTSSILSKHHRPCFPSITLCCWQAGRDWRLWERWGKRQLSASGSTELPQIPQLAWPCPSYSGTRDNTKVPPHLRLMLGQKTTSRGFSWSCYVCKSGTRDQKLVNYRLKFGPNWSGLEDVLNKSGNVYQLLSLTWKAFLEHTWKTNAHQTPKAHRKLPPLVLFGCWSGVGAWGE